MANHAKPQNPLHRRPRHRAPAIAQLVRLDPHGGDVVINEHDFAMFTTASGVGKAALRLYLAQTGEPPERYALVIRGLNGRVRLRWQVPAPLGPRSRPSSS
jgi:hypothetical protein